MEKKNINYFSSIYDMDYIQVGYNFRLPTMCAALGLSQLEKVEDIIKIRRQISNYYNNELKKNSNLTILEDIPNTRCVYQLYSLMLKEYQRREQLQQFLLDNGIFTKVYFNPIHLKSFYRNKFGYKENSLPVTEEISKKILTLPISLRFSNEDQDYIINKINEFFT